IQTIAHTSSLKIYHTIIMMMKPSINMKFFTYKQHSNPVGVLSVYLLIFYAPHEGSPVYLAYDI
ncbi:hypothetical protein ABWK50_00680, partial [Priestia megaterium]|uniref:hypothetical protein n=1 Tax=Priestia megaterium TaxID=1404 RepID=UPI0033947984